MIVEIHLPGWYVCLPGAVSNERGWTPRLYNVKSSHFHPSFYCHIPLYFDVLWSTFSPSPGQHGREVLTASTQNTSEGTIQCGSIGYKQIIFIKNLIQEVLNTLQCHYNAINFLQNIHKSHPIACPIGRGMACLLWVQPMIFCHSSCNYVCNIMLYWTAL